ncbi:hypothetical protein ABZ543_12790 [Streptomyces roseifaciens]
MPRAVKAGPDLAGYLEAAKLDEPLFGDIQKHVLKKALEPSGRRQDVMHPSEIIKPDWCHRAAFFRLRENREPKKHIGFQKENIFEEGHRTHAKWQEWLKDMNRLAGDWRCRACDLVFWNDTTPQDCPRCAAPSRAIDYAEVPLNASTLRISGKSDGYCPHDGCLIEIKTMGLGSLRYEQPGFLARYEVETPEHGTLIDLMRLWKDFRRPLPSAVRQTQLYMYLARHFEDLPVDRTVFFYDFKPTQDTKSYVVLYDESISDPVIEAAEAITDCLATDTPPFCNFNGRAGCEACTQYHEEMT